MKRLLSIQDISCFGKCSQTAALPIISALGIETVLLPTAVLSTHTGGSFCGYSFLSMKDEMKKITEHWKKLGISFDAIYAGYIGTTEQVYDIINLIEDFSGDNTIVYIDPAMADDGKLYSGLSREYVSAIKELCSVADIISPNISEATLLTGYDYNNDYSEETAQILLEKLSKISDKAIITGIHQNNKILTIGKDSKSNKIIKKLNNKIDGMFYGTGDVFASTFIGTYLNGLSFDDAIEFAENFVQECITATLPEREKYWYGINYEKCLGVLTDFYRGIKTV